MRKIRILVIAGLCASLIAGCGNSASAGNSAVETATEEVSSVVEESTEAAETESSAVEESTEAVRKQRRQKVLWWKRVRKQPGQKTQHGKNR